MQFRTPLKPNNEPRDVDSSHSLTLTPISHISTSMSTTRLSATVKSVLSGDSIILRGRPRGNQPPAERQISLAGVTAPRLGSQKKDTVDEHFAYEAREVCPSDIPSIFWLTLLEPQTASCRQGSPIHSRLYYRCLARIWSRLYQWPGRCSISRQGGLDKGS